MAGWTGSSLLLAIMPGCGTFIAHRMAQAPNTYPTWLAPEAPVLLLFNEKLLDSSPPQFAEVGPPPARLRYRVVEPAEYHLKVIATREKDGRKTRYDFEFQGQMPRPNRWTNHPRGTVFLLHGYGLAEFAMAPWAFRLAEDGWRCVLVDLRGHGKSTGKTIYFGIVEARDMSQLANALERRNRIAAPMDVMGDSYGAALALRWKTLDPRVKAVVAVAPYGVLSDAVVNICHDFAPLLPKSLLRSGVQKLPAVLGVPADELNTTTVLQRHPVKALFVAGSGDDVAPPAVVGTLYREAAPGSKLLIVPGTTHETLPYYFSELVPPILAWLNRSSNP